MNEKIKPEITEYVSDVFVEVVQPTLQELLETEKIAAGLLNTPIQLFASEIGENRGEVAADVTRSMSNPGYDIVLHPSLIKTFEEGGVELVHFAISHEIAHILFGDCDRQLPSWLETVFRKMIEEPRANKYAQKRIEEIY